MLWREILSKRSAAFPHTFLKTRQLEVFARSKPARRCSSSVITSAVLIKLPKKRIQVDEKVEIWLTQVAIISAPEFSFWRRFGNDVPRTFSPRLPVRKTVARNLAKPTQKWSLIGIDRVTSRTRGELGLASCARRIVALLESWTLAATLKSLRTALFNTQTVRYLWRWNELTKPHDKWDSLCILYSVCVEL